VTESDRLLSLYFTDSTQALKNRAGLFFAALKLSLTELPGFINKLTENHTALLLCDWMK